MEKKNRITLGLSIVMMTVFLFGATAYAEDPSGAKNWEFNLAPFYLWAVSIEGDQTIGPITVPIKVDFDDIFKNLEAVFTGHFEGMYKKKWGFLVDLNYLNVSDDGRTPLGFKQDVDLESVLGELSGLYRFGYQNHNFDVILGIRYTNLEVDVEIGPFIGADRSKGWADPIVGLRWLWGFADRWTLSVRGDIGGFGVGSDFTWQLAGLIDWQPFKHVSFLGGYRALYQDYEDDSGTRLFRWDATLHGPVIGVNFRW